MIGQKSVATFDKSDERGGLEVGAIVKNLWVLEKLAAEEDRKGVLKRGPFVV